MDRRPPIAYLPAQVYLVKPNDETEQWKLTKPMTNIPNLDPKVFQYENVPGFRFQKAPDGNAPPRFGPASPPRPSKGRP